MHAFARLRSPRLRALLAAGLLAALAPTGAALAESPALDTLQRIARTGTIHLGHRESSVPFSYYDNRRQVMGYSHDLMLRLTEVIRVELQLPALAVRLVPITAQNRIPLVRNGTVDIECGSTTHNREREAQVGFSVSIFLASPRLLVHKDSGIREWSDMDGRRVVITAGTTSERQFLLYNEERGGRILRMAARDHGEAFAMLQRGEAEAFMMDDGLLYGLRARAARPDDWQVVGTPRATEAYACMFRRDDPAFKAVVDRGLTRMMQSGEALRLYRRWFQSPIPPKGVNLNTPPSDALLQLFRQPNDQPLG